MGTRNSSAGEREWRESWEPTLPLYAPNARMIDFIVPGNELGGEWARAERRLEFLVRLLNWMINARAQGVAACPDAELLEAVGRVERLALEVTRDVLGSASRISESVCGG